MAQPATFSNVGSAHRLRSSVSNSLISLSNSRDLLAGEISTLNSNYDGLTSSLSSEALARTNADSALSSRIDNISSALTISANLLPNGGFTNTDLIASGCVNLPSGSFVTDVSNWGRIYEHSSTGNAALWMPPVNVFAGQSYTVSWDFLLFASQGTARVDIACFTGPNGTGSFTYGPSSQSYGGKDFSNGPRDQWTVTIPSGTQSVRVRLVTENVSGLTAIGWRRIKLETGSTATAFTDEASSNFIYASIGSEASTRASADSAIANNVSSLTSRMGSAESNISTFQSTVASQGSSIANLQTTVSAYTPVIANFIYNPSFAYSTASDGWAQSGGWNFDNNYDECKFFNGLSNGGAGIGQSGHYFVASPGAYYSLSLDAWTPGLHTDTGSHLVMDIEWFDAGKNHLAYSPRLTITQNNGGNWTRYSQNGNNNGLTAPQGAVWGQVRCYLEGATVDSGGSICVRRLQAERSPVANPYVDYTDSSALQAQVQTNTGAISNLQGRTAAYWQTSAVAGNNRAQLTIHADANSGAGIDITGDVSISGNLLVGGSVDWNQLATGNLARNASAQWSGSVTTSPGQTTTVPVSFNLGNVKPSGHFSGYAWVTYTTNAYTNHTTYNGKPFTQTVQVDGNVSCGFYDGQGNYYNLLQGVSAANGYAFFIPNIASDDYSPSLQVTATQGNTNTGIVNNGDSYYQTTSASYNMTSVNVRLFWSSL